MRGRAGERRLRFPLREKRCLLVQKRPYKLSLLIVFV